MSSYCSIFFFFLFCLCVFLSEGHASTIEMIHGSIQIVDNTGTVSWKSDDYKGSLNTGETIITGGQDNVEIDLYKKNYIRIAPNSMVVFKAINEKKIIIEIKKGDVLFLIKQLKGNPAIIFETPDGYVEASGEKGTHGLIWTSDETSGAGVGYGELQAMLSSSIIRIPSNHTLLFASGIPVGEPTKNNSNITSRINQVSLLGDSKSAKTFLEKSSRRTRK